MTAPFATGYTKCPSRTLPVFFLAMVSVLFFTTTARCQDSPGAISSMTMSEYIEYADSLASELSSRHDDNMDVYMDIMEGVVSPAAIPAMLDEITRDYVSAVKEIWDTCIIAETVPLENDDDRTLLSRALKKLTRLNTTITYDYLVYMKPGITGVLSPVTDGTETSPADAATGTLRIGEAEENIETEPVPDPCTIAQKAYEDARSNENEICADTVQVVKDSPCHIAMKASQAARNEMKAACGLSGTIH